MSSTGSVYQRRGNGTWVIAVSIDGTRVVKYSRTEPAARQKLAALLVAAAADAHPAQQDNAQGMGRALAGRQGTGPAAIHRRHLPHPLPPPHRWNPEECRRLPACHGYQSSSSTQRMPIL